MIISFLNTRTRIENNKRLMWSKDLLSGISKTLQTAGVGYSGYISRTRDDSKTCHLYDHDI